MNKENKQITKNYIFNSIYKILNICMPLLTAPYLSRVVGAESLGTYAYYYAIAHYFYLIGKMGLNNYGTRQIAKTQNEEERYKTFSSIYSQQIITAGLMIIIYAIFCISQIKVNFVIPLILGIYVIGCLLDIDWLWCGLEKFSTIAIKNIIVKVLTIIGIFIFVKTAADLWKYTMIMSCGMLLGFITLWFGIRKYIKWRKPKLSEVLVHLKPNLILLFPILASNIYRSMDKIMVGQISGAAELGYYDNAEKIIYAISGLITAFTNVMLPRCTKLLAIGNKHKCYEYIKIAINFLYFLIGGMAFGIFALSDRIVILFYGNGYVNSIILLRILSVTILMMIWSEIVRSMWVIPNGKDKIYLCTLSVGAITNLIVNFILIPLYGAKGASVATIGAEFIVPCVQFIFLHSELNYRKMIRNTAPYLISGLSMVFILFTLSNSLVNNVLNLLILIFVGAFVYFLISIVFVYILNRSLFEYGKKTLSNYIRNNK
ncbi:MAG: flippase [Erysipelotrichaceae bacterium]|nr:flippase [Erysipelotrichaceae bacterium]